MRDFVQREFKEVTAPSPYFSHNLAENCRSVDRDWLSGERGQCCVIRPRPPESQDRSTECASFPRGCEKCGLAFDGPGLDDTVRHNLQTLYNATHVPNQKSSASEKN